VPYFAAILDGKTIANRSKARSARIVCTGVENHHCNIEACSISVAFARYLKPQVFGRGLTCDGDVAQNDMNHGRLLP
jgi:hypothetical protein